MGRLFVRPRTSFYSALAGAAAARHAVEAEAAHAAGFEALAHAIAASLNHLAASFVAAGAGDANTLLGVRAFALAHAQVALAHDHAVHHAAAATHAVAQHFAHLLQHAAGYF